jgi:hypothetical protein
MFFEHSECGYLTPYAAILVKVMETTSENPMGAFSENWVKASSDATKNQVLIEKSGYHMFDLPPAIDMESDVLDPDARTTF